MTSDSQSPTTPAKSPGDFGSISPGFMNGMQIPARTSSAPPNLDEQKRDQVRHDSFRAVPSVPTPSVTKQQLPRNDPALIDQPNVADPHQLPKLKKAVPVSHAPPASQTQKPSALPISGISMPMQLHQQQVPVQFGGPSQQIQSQGMSGNSLQMQMPMQLPIGSTQVQQPVFVPGLQPHQMQPQGIMHQGQNLSFTPQMGSQLPQLSNLGMGIVPPYPQQQGGKFSGPRKTPVKITHPDTHDSFRAVPSVPPLSVTKQQLPRKDPALIDQLNGGNFRQTLVPNYGVWRDQRAQPPAQQHVRGILPGPTQSVGLPRGIQRNISDADRWQRATNFQPKGLIPHKGQRKYEVRKVSYEEEAKQRKLKAILNKLTPQNFGKLFEQVKAINIDNGQTLVGVVSQIFDNALMGPTFCEMYEPTFFEMYANICSHLAGELPDFSEYNEKITFRRLLVNKCQEEFERGEREQEEACKADEEGEVKQSEEEREEKRVEARRRKLGNIRLIGELYKKKMLTERIMHECIKKLLGQQETPDEEDIEALCKLMSTIGEMIDHPKAKEPMDAYFERMKSLSNNMKMSSRVRFMLKDTIDLRRNKWQLRRKVEGPEKIEDVILLELRHDSFRSVPSVPAPSVTKQQLPRKDPALIDQPNAADPHQLPKLKKDVPVSHAPPASQTQKSSALPMSGISMPMQLHQQQVPVQFGGPSQQIQSQGMSDNSLQMQMPMQLPIGSTQVQQPFVPGLQTHQMQPQGILRQGQNLSFNPQMGSQLPQLSNLGMGIVPPYTQQQGGKFSGPRKTPVTITLPDTVKEGQKKHDQ